MFERFREVGVVFSVHRDLFVLALTLEPTV